MKKNLILSAALNIVLMGVCLVLLARLGVVEQTEVVEVSPEPVATAETETVAEPDFAEVESVSDVETDETAKRPDLSGMEPEEQIAALVEEGWSQEDAKLYAFGRTMWENTKIMMERFGDSGDEYWKMWSGPEMDWETQRELLEAQHRMSELMEDLFGTDGTPAFLGMGNIPLPKEKVRAAALVQQDYQLMQMKIRQDAGGIMLPEDHEALALLEEERREDLERIFSPEELFEYEVRTSETAMSLRHQLGGMEPTEEEFWEVFRLQAEVNRLGGPHLEGDEEASQRQAEAMERMKEELRTSLGEERYRQYERNQDWSYGRLVSVAKRLDLPREQVDQVFDLKEFSENRQQELRADQELSREERETALKTLGSEVRADLNELLGEEGLELYQQNGGHWLYQLPQ